MVTGATAFWVVVPCRLVKFYGRFVCACCLRYEGSRFLADHRAQGEGRQPSAY
jgi:hypothetical protein